MKTPLISVTLILTTILVGCGERAPHADGQEESVESVQPPGSAATIEVDPDDPTLIVRPFTAEQIRDEWVPGLRLLMRRVSPEETTVERWTVVAADDEGADIEYATVADDGSVVGEPTVARSTWMELRDHASFPATHSSREWVSRSTQLGEFEGWLYRVNEEGAATTQEFFFVPELPGAPVLMRILEGDATVFELEQTARLRPQTD